MKRLNVGNVFIVSARLRELLHVSLIFNGFWFIYFV